MDGEKSGVDKVNITAGQHAHKCKGTDKAEGVGGNFGEPLRITVLKPGGLKPGIRGVCFLQHIKPSYFGEHRRISSLTR